MPSATVKPFKLSLDLPFPEAIAQAARRGIVLPNTYYNVLQGVARAEAFSIAWVTAMDQLLAVRDSLVEALASGQSFTEWKTTILENELLDLPKYRLETIFRTNIQTSYARGTWEQQKVIAKSHPFLMYDAINDARTRPAHKAMDNFVARWDDPIWKTWYPPNGYNCRCTTIALTEAQARARGMTRAPPGARPDPGWNYDLREAPLRPLSDALQERIARSPAGMANEGRKIARKAEEIGKAKGRRKGDQE